jgi:hypothetical protein
MFALRPVIDLFFAVSSRCVDNEQEWCGKEETGEGSKFCLQIVFS